MTCETLGKPNSATNIFITLGLSKKTGATILTLISVIKMTNDLQFVLVTAQQ